MSGLFGYGSNSGVVAELISLGAMDAFLIKGASVTFFRFRYARYTNFAMEAVGQTFGTQPVFGGTSQITLNRVGDLIYYMYVCIELPGICARRKCREGPCEFDDECYESCGFNGSQFPSVNGGPYGDCDPARRFLRNAYPDRDIYRKMGRE